MSAARNPQGTLAEDERDEAAPAHDGRPEALDQASDVVVQYSSEAADDRTRNRKLNRKMDVALLPLLSLLYLFNGLDRSNVGNAETQGFTRDVGVHPDDLNLAVSLFFVTFVTLQPASAAVGRWLGARYWIPIMMLGWGICTIAQAWTRGKATLIAIRLLIGACEAGFYPTAVSYLSNWYPRFDLAVRIALFYGQYAIAGAFGGSIAYGVFHIRGGPLLNWQWLFVIEGIATCVLAIVAWLWLPEGPESAWFLDAEDRILAIDRIRRDHASAVDTLERNRLTRRDWIETGKDWKLWYVLIFNILASVPGQAFTIFLPLVVQGLGYSSIKANLMTVPPNVCGAERGYHILGGLVITISGLIATVTAPSDGGKYAGLCVLLLGGFVSAPLTAAWLASNNPEPGKRALPLGVNGFGNLSGVIGAQVYRSSYAPTYLISFYVTLAFIVLAFIGYTGYRSILHTENRRRQVLLSSMTPGQMTLERTADTGYADKKLTFVYGL